MFLLTHDKKRAQIWSNSIIRDDFEFSGEEKSITESLAELYLGSSEILSHSKRKMVPLVIDLSNTGPLGKGEYFFYMIYSSGQLSKNVIGQRKVNEDQKKWRATAFEGYIVSNTVKLIIQ